MRVNFLVVCAMATTFALLPATVGAAGTVTVSVPDALSLDNRVVVTVPVTVVCDPLPDTPVSSSVSVSLTQAVGQEIAHASGQVSSFGSSFLVCDGVTANVVRVQVQASNIPFHGGPAVISAFASYSTGILFAPCCFSTTNSETGSTGLVAVRLQ